MDQRNRTTGSTGVACGEGPRKTFIIRKIDQSGTALVPGKDWRNGEQEP